MYKRIQYRLDLSSYERLDTDKWYNCSIDSIATIYDCSNNQLFVSFKQSVRTSVE